MLNDLIGLAGVPVIVALLEVFKQSFPELDRRWLPLAALGLGLTLNLVVGLNTGSPMAESLALGLVAGLAASGLYSQGKTILEAKNGKR
jgi:hypothetical protein